MLENAQPSASGGSYECLRCGFHGQTRSGLPPRCCARCRSAYWDRPPKAPKTPKPPKPPNETGSEHLAALGLLPPPAFAHDRLKGA